MVDFLLAALVLAGIREILIITKSHAQSARGLLMDGIGCLLQR